MSWLTRPWRFEIDKDEGSVREMGETRSKEREGQDEVWCVVLTRGRAKANLDETRRDATD